MSSLLPLVEAAKSASRALALADSRTKDLALRELARSLLKHERSILRANQADLAAAKKSRQTAAFLDRLALSKARVSAMAATLEQVALLPDPVGEIVESFHRPNGLKVEKVRLPLGVILMVYESRPNVTADAAALCLKSGNAVLLRGGKESLQTNRAIAQALSAGLSRSGLPKACVQLLPTSDREALVELLSFEGLIDLCIPRGGEGLIRFVAEHARVPVIKHYKGVCHVYVHRSADLDMAERVLVNAKASRPGVCNAAECLLVDRAVAGRFLPKAARALAAAKVELRGCPTTVAVLGRGKLSITPAQQSDFGREFLDRVLAIRVVKNLDQALEHIARFGSEHTEAIITRELASAERFTREVCASAVMVNASTRFNDGGELGLGAEIGISTSRLHAFGPMGLRELTAQKYVVHGQGQVR